MKYRKLRIAWSAWCVVLCLLVVGLWVRSTHTVDVVYGPLIGNRGLYIVSKKGRLSVHEVLTRDWERTSHSVLLEDADMERRFAPFQPWNNRIPHGFVAICLFSLGAIPWIKQRFSLRTLLIGMTLVATGLGLAVYVLRN